MQDEQMPLIDAEEPSLQAEPEGMVPEEGMLPEEGMAGPEGAAPEGEFDLEALLSDIDQQMATEQAPPEGPPQEQRFADALEQARARTIQRENFEAQDQTSQRVSQLEQQIQQIQSRNVALERESTRQSIHNTINEGIKKELTGLGVDVNSKTAKGISRLISNSVLVSVAQAQATSGNATVDPSSIAHTVKSYTKVVKAVAKEMANRQADAEKRVSSSGAQPAPYKLNKGIGELTEKEFSDVVLANLRGMK